MVKERRSKNIGRKQRKKKNTLKRRVSRKTLRRKKRGGRPHAESEPPTGRRAQSGLPTERRDGSQCLFRFIPFDQKTMESRGVRPDNIKVDDIITKADELKNLKYHDLITVKMVGEYSEGKIYFPYTTKIKSFSSSERSGLGIRALLSKTYAEKRVKRRKDRVYNVVGEEITDKEELNKVKTLFQALKIYAPTVSAETVEESLDIAGEIEPAGGRE